jgi:hypothetical protein
LRARDELRLTLGTLMWLRHMLDAEAATRTVPRSFAPYADTLRDWRGAARRIGADLGEDWLEHAAASAPDDGLVNAGLRHHSGSLDTSRVPDLLIEWVRQTEDALAGLCAPGAPDHLRAEGTLDDIRAEFDRTMAPFGDAEEPRYLAWVDTAGARQAAARDALARNEQLDAERDALKAELERVKADTGLVVADRNRLRAEYDHANAERKELTAALDASRFEVHALRTSMSWRVTAPLRALYRLAKQSD